MRPALRVGFAGTPEFARVALAALCDAGFHIAVVMSQPDRPSGRGMKLQPGAVKAFALEQGLPVWQPTSLKTEEAQRQFEAYQLDVLVVAAYGLILPAAILAAPRLGCVNIHGSLLPRWRGAAPIHRAILAGDRQTGITIMQMDVGLDTGPMLSVHPIPMDENATTASLHDQLAAVGGTAVVAALDALAAGTLTAVAQPDAGVTYAAKIEKVEAALNWAESATQLHRQIRAFNPAPGASTTLAGTALKIWHAQLAADAQGVPGTVLAITEEALTVAAGTGALVLTQVQRPGGKRLSVRDWLRGEAVQVGQRFGD